MSNSNSEDALICGLLATPADQEDSAIESRLDWYQKLSSGDCEVQLETLVKLGQHQNVSGVCELVIGFAGSRIDSHRAAAAKALERSVQPTSVETPALIAALADVSDGEISYWAATLLGRLGQQAMEATGALCDCVQKSSFLPARERAAWALLKMGPAASEAIPVLKSVSETAPARLRKLCQNAIGEIVIGESGIGESGIGVGAAGQKAA